MSPAGPSTLRCPVRGCEQPLALEPRVAGCPRGHRIDRGREGYWPLAQPQDRRSSDPGDTDAAVTARRRWLHAGLADGLVEQLKRVIGVPPTSGWRLDLGCGEGYFGRALFESTPDRYCGIDLSRRAIRMAARYFPAATWVWGNADRVLPVHDGHASLVMSLFGRRPVAEIARVLASGGRAVVVTAGPDDLIELRDAVQSEGRQRDRTGKIVQQFESEGLHLRSQHSWCEVTRVAPDRLADALAMTYRGVRRSQHRTFDSAMALTCQAEVMEFVRDN